MTFCQNLLTQECMRPFLATLTFVVLRGETEDVCGKGKRRDVSAHAGTCTAIDGKLPGQDALMGRNVCDSLGRILSEGPSQKFLRGNLNVPRGRRMAEARGPSYLGLIHANAECQNMLSRLLVLTGPASSTGLILNSTRHSSHNRRVPQQQQIPPR